MDWGPLENSSESSRSPSATGLGLRDFEQNGLPTYMDWATLRMLPPGLIHGWLSVKIPPHYDSGGYPSVGMSALLNFTHSSRLKSVIDLGWIPVLWLFKSCKKTETPPSLHCSSPHFASVLVSSWQQRSAGPAAICQTFPQHWWQHGSWCCWAAAFSGSSLGRSGDSTATANPSRRSWAEHCSKWRPELAGTSPSDERQPWKTATGSLSQRNWSAHCSKWCWLSPFAPATLETAPWIFATSKCVRSSW